MEIKKLSAPSNEDEIKQHWKYKNKVYISCVCITFNQKDYIRDAIDSFLAQETEYRFDIIIHDDVSTDGTRDILLEYKNKYPSIIKLVLQDENQYKLGKKITPLAVGYATGEYIALCEGDDFWIDKLKLQAQISYISKNSVSVVCSRAIDSDKNIIPNYFSLNRENKLTLNEMLFYPGDYIVTASLMFKRSLLKYLPDSFNSLPVGDYYFQLILANKVEIHMLNEILSYYRLMSEGSWSSSIGTKSKDDILSELNFYINSNMLFSKETKIDMSMSNALNVINAIKALIKTGSFFYAAKLFFVNTPKIFTFYTKRFIKCF